MQLVLFEIVNQIVNGKSMDLQSIPTKSCFNKFVKFIFTCFPGMDNFEQLLAGGHFMDQHFVNAPLEQNVSMKIILRKFFSSPEHEVLK